MALELRPCGDPMGPVRMNLDIFIPPMSSESGRVFSSLKHMITSELASLTPEVIDALECVKHWVKTGIFMDKELTAIPTLAEEVEGAKGRTKPYTAAKTPDGSEWRQTG